MATAVLSWFREGSDLSGLGKRKPFLETIGPALLLASTMACCRHEMSSWFKDFLVQLLKCRPEKVP